MSTIRHLLSVNSIIAVTLILGFVNNVAITAIFGLNRSVDVYFASFVMVRLFMVLVVDYLGKNFLPIYSARIKESAERASELTSLVVTQVAVLAIVITLLLIAVSEHLFSLILPGFEQADVLEVVGMFTIMAPTIVMMSVDAFHSYVWQHNEQYSRVVASRVCRPITRFVFIIGLSPWLGVLALPVGYLVGQLITSVTLSIRVPYRYRPRFSLTDPDWQSILMNSSVLVGTGVIARSRGLIIQYFGSTFGEGAIAAISIASRMAKPVYQSAQLGLRMIVFTRAARAAASENVNRIGRLHTLGLSSLLLVVSPVAAWYAVEANVIIQAIFERGEFTPAMGQMVAAALIGLIGSVVFMGVNQMLSNGFYAMSAIRVPAIVMPLGSVILFIVASNLAPAYGVTGLTASASVSAAVLGVVLTIFFKRLVPAFKVSAVVMALIRSCVGGVLAALAARYAREYFALDAIPGFLLSGTVLVTSYFLIMLMIRDPVLQEILSRTGIPAFARSEERSG